MTPFIRNLLIFCTLVFCRCLAADTEGYLFVTFRNEINEESEQVYFALSSDARNWTVLNQSRPVLMSDVGEHGVRDFYLLRAHNGGKFYLMATDLSVYHNRNWQRNTHAGSKSLVIWKSDDLVNWSKPNLVKVAPDNAGCTWAPEAIWDEETQDYLVYWSSTTSDDHYAKTRVWSSHTRDFESFSPPSIYIERNHAVIDADIVFAGGKYYRFSKDETTKVIEMEVSEKLSGPWKSISTFPFYRGYEAPECFPLEPLSTTVPTKWCLILDHFSKGDGYKPFITSDLPGGKFTPATDFHFPFPFRHGSVLQLTGEEYQRLKTAFELQ